jgi:hypothetical protein
MIQMMDTGAEKLEMTAGAIEPVFNDYLTEFLQSIPDTKGSRVFLARWECWIASIFRGRGLLSKRISFEQSSIIGNSTAKGRPAEVGEWWRLGSAEICPHFCCRFLITASVDPYFRKATEALLKCQSIE